MEGYSMHLEGIKKQVSENFERILIEDAEGVGMLNANASFQLAKPYITADYVYLLDDDDYLIDADFTQDIERIARTFKPDIIFVKNNIINGLHDNTYPTKRVWLGSPKRGEIGGSCFIVKNWLFQKYIHLFAQPSFGDFHFIDGIMKNESTVNYWHDKLVMRTYKVSHGGV